LLIRRFPWRVRFQLGWCLLSREARRALDRQREHPRGGTRRETDQINPLSLHVPVEKRIMDIPALTSRTGAFHNAAVRSLNESVFT
jgi:hypothetical protein